MATRYNVYASDVESDADSSGTWVLAAEHTEEVESLEEKINELDSLLDETKSEKEALEVELAEQAMHVDALTARIEELERGLLEIINS